MLKTYLFERFGTRVHLSSFKQCSRTWLNLKLQPWYAYKYLTAATPTIKYTSKPIL